MMHRLNILRIASEQHGNALIIYSRKKYGKSLVKSARAKDEFYQKYETEAISGFGEETQMELFA